MEEEDKENEVETINTIGIWDNVHIHDESSNASSSSSVGDLEIVTEKASISTPSRKRKAAVSMPEELENLEVEIEEQLDSKAKKSRLTVANVKNILRHVITNQHVMAMVKKSMKDCGEACSSDDDCPYEPKLTRAKTKELLQTHTNITMPWPVTPTKPVPPSATKILIDAVLPDEEDDDEEYQPVEDDEVSDDEGTSLASDIESISTPQPVTPRSNADCSTQTMWTEDGVFKVPPQTDVLEHEGLESIGQRTRSKLSLSNTDLETIEQSFVPPDITTDMYDLECDNEDWRNFLTEFTKPLNTVTNETVDDDEADPEYNILEDEEAEDKEELRADRAVKVSKKELNELISELMEFMESSEDETEHTNEKIMRSVQPTQSSTPLRQSISNMDNECSFASLRLSNQQSPVVYMHSPQKPYATTSPTNLATPTPADLTVLLSSDTPKTPHCSTQTTQQTSITPPIPSVTAATVLTPPALQNPVPVQEGENSDLYILPNQLEEKGLRKEEFVLPERIARLAESTTEVVTITNAQRMLLAQQMRQHVQLLAQSYMQSIIIPEMHCCAIQTKENLMSLKYLQRANKNSAFYVENLKDAIVAVNTWDSYLQENNPKSKEMKQFVEEEKSRVAESRKKKQALESTHSKLFLDLVSHNKAFMYPLLLPKRAFRSRCDVPRCLIFNNSETMLLLLGLEQFIPYIVANPELHSKKKTFTLDKVSDLISEFLLPAKTSKAIYNYITRLKGAMFKDNIIKTFFLNGTIPGTNHYVINCKPTPPLNQPKELLPEVFRNYIYGKDTDVDDLT